MKTPTIPAALALALALTGLSAAQDNPYNMGSTADGRTVVAPGTYGPFQGPTCEAGSAGCSAVPTPVQKPQDDGKKKDDSDTACLATNPADPNAMAAAMNSLIAGGNAGAEGAVTGAQGSTLGTKPAQNKEEVLPNGDTLIHFSNGDVSYCSSTQCSMPGPAANNPQYQQFLASKAQKEADKKSVDEANCRMFACDGKTAKAGGAMSATSVDAGGGPAVGSPAGDVAGGPGGSADGSEGSDSEGADYAGMGSMLASGGPMAGGGGSRANGRGGPSAETTMGQQAMESSGQLAGGRSDRAALASQYSYVRLQKAITNNSGLDDVARFGTAGNASGPDDGSTVVPGGTRASANR